ncbi:Starch-binding associating with outer membrane [Filimonas lacunae]|uniref:Starch-binding associating with outer membrane n=1 Tax=Filimonas lacunae TaxID=477680 RepID=A0A173MDB2_9BACT|nr:RagB/SusD family nutrient uptake outer membrane protein [Filimonas lacunae]BAV05428.1 outer membrane protein, nutrient binding [Filimonas lacunae]SIT21209.1 Starch-binding associating with outer membrane [Filimonas lacunae]
MKKAIYSVTILLAALISTSCNKWLDQKPQDGVVRQEFWKTKEQVEAAVIGCYSSLLGSPSGVTDKALAEYLFLWGELRADLVAAGAGITNEETEVINVNLLSTNSLVSWRALYRTINYCNTVLDDAPDVLETDNTFTQEQLNGYIGEALALRSLLYFYLARSFGDVPLKLTSTSTDEDIRPIAKSTQKQVLQQVLTDLQTAETKIKETYGTKQYNTGRITKNTVQTIMADVYLWLEDYTNAIAYCDKVIDSKNYSLVSGNSGFFSTLYYTGNSSEGIFEFQFDAQKLNPFYSMFTTTKRRYVASERVMEDVYTIDYDDETKVDIRGAATAVRTSDNTIWKYVGFNYATARAQGDSYAHWIIYRYADVLLMKAEALAQVNRGQEALDLVQVIRDRAGALDATARNPDAADTDEITTYILEERAREFAFEGKRWYDVLRNAKRNNYARLEILLNMVAAAVPADRQQSALNKYRDYNSHYFPIAETELQRNSSLKQNTFYQ